MPFVRNLGRRAFCLFEVRLGFEPNTAKAESLAGCRFGIAERRRVSPNVWSGLVAFPRLRTDECGNARRILSDSSERGNRVRRIRLVALPNGSREVRRNRKRRGSNHPFSFPALLRTRHDALQQSGSGSAIFNAPAWIR